MHQDATWYGGRPQLRRLCVKWGPTPQKKGGGAPSPILRVDVENLEMDWKCGALPALLVIADFIALEQQIILVKTRSELVYKWWRHKR